MRVGVERSHPGQPLDPKLVHEAMVKEENRVPGRNWPSHRTANPHVYTIVQLHPLILHTVITRASHPTLKPIPKSRGEHLAVPGRRIVKDLFEEIPEIILSR